MHGKRCVGVQKGLASGVTHETEHTLFGNDSILRSTPVDCYGYTMAEKVQRKQQGYTKVERNDTVQRVIVNDSVTRNDDQAETCGGQVTPANGIIPIDKRSDRSVTSVPLCSRIG